MARGDNFDPMMIDDDLDLRPVGAEDDEREALVRNRVARAKAKSDKRKRAAAKVARTGRAKPRKASSRKPGAARGSSRAGKARSRKTGSRKK